MCGQPRCRFSIDCAGAQLHVHTRRSATVLGVHGEIDAFNADLVGDGIRRYARLKAPVVLDLSQLDLLSAAGFRMLLILNEEHERAGLHWSVVSGARSRRVGAVFPKHGLPLVDSVSEALHIVDDLVQTRRRWLAVPARQHEPQRDNSSGRAAGRRAIA
ncbi:hypothetical protein BHQ21_10425 [Mycobacterium sherrisii]|uniref:STAS domain-containing protein n=2 Tax=Mycobacterium sherrisii TaxID=243061 RepID=A0A1E3SXC6_9MYCO|nr:hypothetical protein BHQ21_10425 [Mycobacterium sherrisii]